MTSKRILIYYPSNSRAVDLQSSMELFRKMYHEVYLLTFLPIGDLHKNVEPFGVKTFTCGFKKNNGILAYLKHIVFLFLFIRRHKITDVFAHLQPAGLVAGVVNKLTSFNLFYVRHNTDEHILSKNSNAISVNYLVNKLVPTIIAPSNQVFNYLTKFEKITSNKIFRINYGYNFNQYFLTDKNGESSEIRRLFNCELLVISVCRLVAVKRHLLMFDIIEYLHKNNLNVKLICLGEGDLKDQLISNIKNRNLETIIYILGNKNNVFDYLEASDIFLHLSETEASNSAVKEAAICNVPAIVCKNVGDFEDYIVNDQNGYLVDKNTPFNDVVKIIEHLYFLPNKINEIGQNAHQSVRNLFDINNTQHQYENILSNIKFK